MIEILPIAKIKPSKSNPRRELGELAELAASIKTMGVLEPLIVAPDEGRGYTVVVGHRRLAAAKKAGLAEVPAIVKELDETERAEVALVENLQREDLSPIDEASAYRRVLDLGRAQRELAVRIGRSQSHISKRLALLALPAPAIAKLDSGGITLDQAVGLTKLADHPGRVKQVLAAGKGSSVDYELERQQKDLQRGERRKELEAKAKEQGVRVIPWPKHGAVARPLKQKTIVYLDHPIDLTVAKHRREKCHAAAVHGGFALSAFELVYFCTDPSRHGIKPLRSPSGRAAGAVDPTHAKKREAHTQAMKVAEEARGQFVRGLIKKVPAKEAVPAFVGAQLVAAACQLDVGELAVELLGVGWAETKQRPRFITARETERSLETHAGKGGKGRAQVALAIALAVGEIEARDGFDGRDGAVKRHFQYLKEHGYSLSGAERLELSGKAPR